MQKEEVIKAIDKLIDLEKQKQSILSKYQDAILSYADNKPLSLDFEECDYIRDLLLKAKEEIINYWDEEHEKSDFDNEIAETLRLAGVKLNEAVQVGRYKYKTVSDLMNELQNCDPEAVVIVSEKWGRGAAQFHIRTGYTDTNYLEVIGSQEPTEEYPTKAIEISAAM